MSQSVEQFPSYSIDCTPVLREWPALQIHNHFLYFLDNSTWSWLWKEFMWLGYSSSQLFQCFQTTTVHNVTTLNNILSCHTIQNLNSEQQFATYYWMHFTTDRYHWMADLASQLVNKKINENRKLILFAHLPLAGLICEYYFLNQESWLYCLL